MNERRGLEGEERASCVEGVGESVDIGGVVVDVDRGASSGANAEEFHERLGAMVAGANADRVLVENLGDVVGMQAVEIETEHAAALKRA